MGNLLDIGSEQSNFLVDGVLVRKRECKRPASVCDRYHTA
jgi:hypothetical protein